MTLAPQCCLANSPQCLAGKRKELVLLCQWSPQHPKHGVDSIHDNKGVHTLQACSGQLLAQHGDKKAVRYQQLPLTKHAMGGLNA